MNKLDDMVREYLLYRGFTSTLRIFENELRNDKLSGVDRLIDAILNYVSSSDLNNLREIWKQLKLRFFSYLETSQTVAVKKLELSLYRYYLVTCLQSNRSEKVHEFFEKMSHELIHQQEWKDWFSIPYIKNPETTTPFALFFSRPWQDTFLVSLHNFLNVVIYMSPQPSLLSFEAEAERIEQMRLEIELLKTQSDQQRTLPTLKTKRGLDDITGEVLDDFFIISSDSKFNDVHPPTKRDGHPPASLIPPDALYRIPPRSPIQNSPDYASVDVLGADNKLEVVSQSLYTEHSAPLRSCQFSSSGIQVASCDKAGVVKVWNSTNFCTQMSLFSEYPLLCCDWVSRQENLLLVGNSKCSIRLNDVEKEKSVYELKTPTAYPQVASICVNPVGNRFVSSAYSASASGGSLLSLWNLQNGKVEKDLPIGNGLVTSLSFNHNGSLLATGCQDGTITIFDLKKGESLLNWLAVQSKGQSNVKAIRFSFDEKSLISLDGLGNLKRWSLHKKKENTNVLLPQNDEVPFDFMLGSQGRCLLVARPSSTDLYRFNSALSSCSDEELSLRHSVTYSNSKSKGVCFDWTNCTVGSTLTFLSGTDDSQIIVTYMQSSRK